MKIALIGTGKMGKIVEMLANERKHEISRVIDSPEAALKHFLESRQRTVELLKNTPDLRAHVVDSGLLGKIDAYERILFVGAHSERHTKQLLEVKADPNFPKK